MKNILILLILLTSFQGFSQISHGGKPISTFNKNLTPTIPVYTAPKLDIQQYINEDLVTDHYKDIAWRFGIEQFVLLDLTNSGVWETLDNGDRLWRLKIKSPNAKTINLNFSDFFLPKGATFFVFNKNQTLGSFTSENNKATRKFSTSLVKGSDIILEYYEPLSSKDKGTIVLESLVHGYRDLYTRAKAFGSSGACNVNAICDTTFWDNEIRSAVMLLTSGNTRFCSGALVNNSLQDGKPYILTAEHCKPAVNNIFVFNYQSRTCATNTDGTTSQSVSGCFVRSRNTPSDFALLELSSIPPADYNVFYAGWSKIDVAPKKGTAIHFPRQDVKKISHELDLLVESEYTPFPGLNHWRVIDWDSGTTEGGSSGSPLFDQNHRIVGQLHGGEAECGNDGSDYYGKFSHSWDTDASSNKQLKFWLDPNNTGQNTLDGYDPNGSKYLTDASLLSIDLDNFICDDSISPTISIRNNGSNSLTSLTINYKIDGVNSPPLNWTGNLPTHSIDVINIPTAYIPGGTHSLEVSCTNPNGTIDEKEINNNAIVNFTSNENPVFGQLYLRTDDFGTELSWEIQGPSGNTVLTGNGYNDVQGGEQLIETLCLSDSCYTFILNDSFGDGYCCNTGNGELQLIDSAGDTLLQDNTFNGSTISFPFCLKATAIDDYSNLEQSISIYPNPTKSGRFTISNTLNDEFDITIHNIIGEEVFSQLNLFGKKINIDLTNTKKGVYLIGISSKQNKFVKRLVIN